MAKESDKPAKDERPPEWDRFETFARKLVQVPKEQIDKARKANGRKP